jgi:hypothetical protein
MDSNQRTRERVDLQSTAIATMRHPHLQLLDSCHPPIDFIGRFTSTLLVQEPIRKSTMSNPTQVRGFKGLFLLLQLLVKKGLHHQKHLHLHHAFQ